jgi:hypothetical protein
VFRALRFNRWNTSPGGFSSLTFAAYIGHTATVAVVSDLLCEEA